MACLFGAALAAQLLAPYLAYMPCGLIIPHEHILLGRADLSDLERHEAAEAACAAGKPARHDPHVRVPDGSRGRILNIIHFDGRATSPVVSLDILIGAMPTPLIIQDIQQIYADLDPQHLPGQSVSIAPPSPPPKAA